MGTFFQAGHIVGDRRARRAHYRVWCVGFYIGGGYVMTQTDLRPRLFRRGDPVARVCLACETRELGGLRFFFLPSRRSFLDQQCFSRHLVLFFLVIVAAPWNGVFEQLCVLLYLSRQVSATNSLVRRLDHCPPAAAAVHSIN